MTTLAAACCSVLETAEASTKAGHARAVAADWREGALRQIGQAVPSARPARPPRPELKRPGEVPKRKINRGTAGRSALLHALAHIELNAVDLAADIIARFSGENLPTAFFEDWLKVADEEGKHYLLLAERLADLGVAYGDLPAHDGLWQAAEETAHDLLARLAVVPLVLEARGLDVTPAMIERMSRFGDDATAALLRTIYYDEIGHVAVGRKWFGRIARSRGLDAREAWQTLVEQRFRGALKPPFNREARDAAGLPEDWYADTTVPTGH